MRDGSAQLQAFWQRSVRLAFAIAGIGALGLLAGRANGAAAAVGFLLGAAASAAGLRMRYKVLTRGTAPGPLVRARLLAYGLKALALALAVWHPEVAWPWSTVAGLFVMNAALVVTELRWKETGPAERQAPADASS